MTQMCPTPEELPGLVGSELGTGEWRRVTQHRINQFAEATEDDQWIHTDPQAAAQGPFGATIAHGFLVLSLLPALTTDIFELDAVDAAINYRVDNVRFRSPVPVGSRLRATARLTAVRPRPRGYLEVTTSVRISCDNGTTACTADQVTLYVVRTDATAGTESRQGGES